MMMNTTILQNNTHNKKNKPETFALFDSNKNTKEGFTETFDFPNFNNICNNTTNSTDYNKCLSDVKVKATDLSNYQTIYNDINTKINNGYYNLSGNITKYNNLNDIINNTNYDTIDNNGNLIYDVNTNFKETIPNLKDAVLEDTNNLVNYQNNIYIFSGIIAVSLIVASIIIIK